MIKACLFWYLTACWKCPEFSKTPRYIHQSHRVLLNHWGLVTHICVINWIIIASDNGLSPWRRQAIVLTNAGILLIGHLGTNFSEILIGIHTISSKKIHLKMSSAKWRPFSFGLNVLTIPYKPISNNHTDVRRTTIMTVSSLTRTNELLWNDFEMT